MMNRLLGYFVFAVWACFGMNTLAQSSPVLEEHEMLKMDEGVWSAKITMWADPDTEPTISTAKETNTMVGKLWSIGKLEGNIGGMDYVGYATLGYDPIQKKYVGTWVDSVTPAITQMVGTYGVKTKTLTLFYSISGPDGQEEKRKNVMVYKDKSTRDFTMFIKNGDEWIRSMEIMYARIE